ncbi:uncharacterized protein LOC131624791 [Vicia villosa]|uniref:uncharacterized protein LOC131624791 n=1 Tax=Vicia villosa TaxID=3911 RepID=UPI00273A9E92|nr:uncharacterized protein LOC131624791 [Vicia villosa]
MIVSWNVRGLNKKSRCKEVAAHLKKLHASCCILIETRVKEHNANKIRHWLGTNWSFADNYSCHPNGRLWLGWDKDYWEVNITHKSEQHMHCEMKTEQSHMYVTLVYAHNQLEKCKKLWKDISLIAPQIQDPWMIIGDYNNVLKLHDRIGGNDVHRAEYIDLEEMMSNIGLYEHATRGSYYTWSNKHSQGTIYSRIDRAICNGEWYLKFPRCEIDVLQPYISDHSPLKVNLDHSSITQKCRPCFKFLNCVTQREDYIANIKENWQIPIEGRPMYICWRKLIRLQKTLSLLNRDTTAEVKKIQQSRDNLMKAQSMLENDRFNPGLIDQIKHWTDEIIKGTAIEEKILIQKAKVDWLQLGDGNNRYFHAIVNQKNKQKSLLRLENRNGIPLTEFHELEDEILNFYSNLVGITSTSLDHVNIMALREGATGVTLVESPPLLGSPSVSLEMQGV